MNDVPRRTLLAMGATGFAVGGAGCLNDDSGSDGNGSDESGNGNDGSALAPPARWIPTSAGSKLFFSYTDLEPVRTHESTLSAETLDEIPFVPHGAGGRVVGRMETEPTFEYVLEFGPSGKSGHYVMRGDFDLAGLDLGDPIEEVGEFERFEAAGASIAASSDTLVVVDPEIGSLDDVLAASLDGTDRRVDGGDSLGRVLEHVGGGTLAYGIVPESTDKLSVGQSWSIAAETVTYAQVMLGKDTSEVDEDQLKSELATESPFDRFDEFSLDVEGDVILVTGTLPTSELRYSAGIFKDKAGLGTSDVSVSIDVETALQTVTVSLMSYGYGASGRVEVRDSSGTRATLTEQGEEAILEYDVGDTETITVVYVNGDIQSEITAKSVEF